MKLTVDFKKIAIILLILTAIGIIHIYPDLRFICELGDRFRGITLNAIPDAQLYLRKINSVYFNGNITMPAVDIYEHARYPWFLPFLGELILGKIGASLKIPINYFKIVFTFFLPILHFCLIYLLAFLISRSRLASIITASGVVLGYSFFANNPVYVYKVIFDKSSAIHLWFERPVSPQVSYIPLFTSWIFIYLFMIYKSYRYAILSGISIAGFLYIGGPYYLSYFGSFLGLLLLLSVAKKDFFTLKRIIVMLIVMAVIAIPYAVNYFKLMSFPNYKFLMEQTAAFCLYGRRPILPAGITAISAFLIWFHYTRKTKEGPFIILFVLAGFICLNQQLITGKTLEPSHWQNYMMKTFTIIALFTTLALFLKGYKYLQGKRKLLTCTVIFLLMGLAILQQENYYQRFKDKFTRMQSLAGPFNWLKANTKPEDVVLNDPMNILEGRNPDIRDILMYTNNFLYLPIPVMSLIYPEEREYRYLAGLRFFGYNLQEAEKLFVWWDGVCFRGIVPVASFGGSGSNMPKGYLEHLKNKYSEYLGQDAIKLLLRYKINYFIVSRSSSIYNNMGKAYPRLLKVYNDDEYAIYKL